MENERKVLPTISTSEVSAVLYAIDVAIQDIAVPIEVLASSAIAILLVSENGERTGDDIRFKGGRVAQLFIHAIEEIARHLEEMEENIPSQEDKESLH